MFYRQDVLADMIRLPGNSTELDTHWFPRHSPGLHSLFIIANAAL